MSRKAAPSRRTRVVTLAGTKGGTGKTTLASALAVRAAEDSPKVALIDLDPLASLSSWSTRRGKTKNPKLLSWRPPRRRSSCGSRKVGVGVYRHGPDQDRVDQPGIAVATGVDPNPTVGLRHRTGAIQVELCESHVTRQSQVFASIMLRLIFKPVKILHLSIRGNAASADDISLRMWLMAMCRKSVNVKMLK